MPLEYQSLDPSLKQIRLLTLLPASDSVEDTVSAILQTVSLNDEPAFEALSYVWGDERDTIEINVDGKAANVTRNLGTALRRLRGSAPLVLWVDALCINQSDIIEKNHQVPLMSEIYTKSQEVLIWLGEGDHDIEELFRAVNSRPPTESINGEISPDTIQSERNGGGIAMLGYINLFNLPYWRRMWTYQEMALSTNDPVCLYGNIRSPLSVFFLDEIGKLMSDIDRDQPLMSIEQERVGLSVQGTGFSGLRAMLDRWKESVFAAELVRQARETKSTPYVAIQLAVTAGRASKDPRDRVFAIYGLCPILNKIHQLDYGNHCRIEQMLLEVTVYNVQHEVVLMDSFALLRMRQDGLSNTALPSWVPDYNTPTRRDPHMFVCARSLQRRSSHDPMPATRMRDTNVLIGQRNIGVGYYREYTSTTVPDQSDTSDEASRAMLSTKEKHDFTTSCVNGTEVAFLPDIKYDLSETSDTEVGHDSTDQADIPPDQVLRLLGDQPTLHMAGRLIGTCSFLQTFGTDKDENTIVLCRILDKMRMNNNSGSMDMMIRIMMRNWPMVQDDLPSLERLRAFADVAITREPSGSFKLEDWIRNAAHLEIGHLRSTRDPDEERILRAFYVFAFPVMEVLATKTIFAVSGLELVGMADDAVADGDIVMTPIYLRSVPLILRKVQSGDSQRVAGDFQGQHEHQSKESMVFYKLVGPAVICGLTEESELVSRLAEQHAEDFFIR
ncbi:hypothetical protein G7054_g9012 [Neopestalotiopsis clavispora]|nr:hypothetical protein G7054_g9012 [Neopestalotiopsis clavispora]